MQYQEQQRLEASPGARRCGEMVACLRQSLMYSEKRVRDLLFRAIEDLIARASVEGPIPLSRLTKEAAVQARRSAAEAGFEFAHWEIASKAVLRAMVCAGVLSAEAGAPVEPGIAAQAARISGLQPGFCDSTEAFLLEFLIRKLGNVSVRDHTPLAHALFRQFDASVSMDDLEDRLATLLAMLKDRVLLCEDGRYAVSGPEPL